MSAHRRWSRSTLDLRVIKKKKSQGRFQGAACLLLYSVTSLIRNGSAPWDHHMTLGIGPLKDPRRKRFLVSEVPL